MKQMIFGVVGKLFWEIPGTRRNFADHMARLERTADEISARAQGAEPTDRNREWFAHLIGIERWSQRRLQVGFGAPFVAEEYDSYRPALDTPWNEMVKQFRDVRSETVQMAQRYADDEGDAATEVAHNDFGGLTPRGWFEYLRVHASLTSQLIR